MASLISVIVPVYNSAVYLTECLDSLKKQNFKDVEFIIINDGSKDSSREIIDNYAKNDSRFIAIHKNNEGVSAARNDGLKIAKGEFVFFCDSDDILAENALDKLYQKAKTGNADVVIGDYIAFNENRKKAYSYFSHEFSTKEKNIIEQIQQMVLYRGYSPYYTKDCGYLFSTPWGFLIKKEIFEKNKIDFPKDLNYYEDGIVLLKIFEFASVVAYIKNEIYLYRITKNSLCHSEGLELIEKCSKASSYISNFITEFNKGNEFTNAYYARMIFFLKKIALKSFFIKEFPGSFFKKYKCFKQLVKSKEYKKATQNIKYLKLKESEKYFGFVLRFRLAFFYALAQHFRNRFK